MARDLALILEGGGAQGAYVFGAMQGLEEIFNDQYGLANFNFMAGSSVSALSILYALSGQFHTDMEDIWTKKYATKEVFNRRNGIRLFSGRPVYDVGYLVDDILKKQHPIAWNKLQRSYCKFYIPLVDVKTLKLVFYTNDFEISSALLPYELVFMDKKNPNEIYSVLHAAMATPVYYNREIEIQGGKYINGSLLAPFPLTAPIPSSAKRICILSKPQAPKVKWFTNRLLPSVARAGIMPGNISNSNVYNMYSAEDKNYNTLLNQLDISEDDILIRPKRFLSTSNNSPQIIKRNIHLGYIDAMELKDEIQTLVNKV